MTHMRSTKLMAAPTLFPRAEEYEPEKASCASPSTSSVLQREYSAFTTGALYVSAGMRDRSGYDSKRKLFAASKPQTALDQRDRQPHGLLIIKLTHGPQPRNGSRDDGDRLDSPQIRIEEDIVCACIDDKQGGLHVDGVGAGEEGGDLLVGRRDGDGRIWTGEALNQGV